MTKRFLSLLSLFLFLFFLNSCREEVGGEKPAQTGHSVQVWVTNSSGTKLISEDKSIVLSSVNANTSGTRISPAGGQLLQEIEGFGAALTGSSAYLMHRKMTAAQRTNLLTELFHKEKGIGISYLRITMGASDFSLEDYTYNDLTAGLTDPELTSFSIEKDKEDIIPILKEILSISPDIKIMASPWSAPAWMKTGGKLAGGSLKPEFYTVYANYFLKYLKAYAQEGIIIDAISVQNEPLHEATYPSMRMEASEQAEFIRKHLGPLFEKENMKVKILAYDHNWDRTDYPLHILGDKEAAKYIHGTAFHAYAGEVQSMTQVRNASPEKGIYFTEISGGEWSTDFGNNLTWNMKNIFIGGTRNWSKNALLWNLALDQNHGPRNGGCQDCRGVVTVREDGTFGKNVEYFAIGHFSKFVMPGSRRIATEAINGLEQVAFLNPDGSMVVIISNDSGEHKRITIEWGQKQLTYNQEARSVITYKFTK